jgi:hypothetical protein
MSPVGTARFLTPVCRRIDCRIMGPALQSMPCLGRMDRKLFLRGILFLFQNAVYVSRYAVVYHAAAILRITRVWGLCWENRRESR